MGRAVNKRARWSHKKGAAPKHASQQLAAAVSAVSSMASSQPESMRPVHPSCCFNMMLGLAERNRMIDYLWGGEYGGAVGELARANPGIARWLAEITKNQHYPATQSLHHMKVLLKFESMIAQQVRCQNEHIMPLWTVVNSVEAHRAKRDRLAKLHLLALACTCLHLRALIGCWHWW